MKTAAFITVRLLAFALVATRALAHGSFGIYFDVAPLPPEWTGEAAWSTGPVGWEDPGALQATPTKGGWTLGDGGGPRWELNEHEREDIQPMIASGYGRVSFDVMVDGTSFNTNAQQWRINIAGNSSSGWTQIENIVDAWQNAGQSNLRVYHFETNFAALGWTATNSTFYQLFFGGNSAAANPIFYWIDNVKIIELGPPDPIEITSRSFNPATHELTLTWTSGPGISYSVRHTTNLSTAFTPVAAGLVAAGSTVTTTVTLPVAGAGFVRVQTE